MGIWGALFLIYVQMSQCELPTSCDVLYMGESYRDLIVWRKGMELVTEIYRATRLFPRDEAYGLTSQLRRGGGFGAQQYCGRAGALFSEGISSVSKSRKGIVGGD